MMTGLTARAEMLYELVWSFFTIIIVATGVLQQMIYVLQG